MKKIYNEKNTKEVNKIVRCVIGVIVLLLIFITGFLSGIQYRKNTVMHNIENMAEDINSKYSEETKDMSYDESISNEIMIKYYEIILKEVDNILES